jgi:hypothetical protein
MPHLTNWENGRFSAEFFGEVFGAEIDAVNAEFCGDARFDSVRSSIWDMSQVSNLNLALSEIEYAAAFDKGASMSKPLLRGAIVVSNGHVREMIEKYLSISEGLENNWETRIFDDIVAAKMWVES